MSRSDPMPDPAFHAPRVTWDQFVELDEDDPRELVDGALVEVDVNDLAHENAVAEILTALRLWTKSRGGVALASGYKVRISETRGVMPDVQVTRAERLSLLDPKGFVRGAPDLVVEVVSESSVRHDRVVKLGWYASIGVPEYWLVDPRAKTLERLVLGAGGRYTIAESLAEEAVFEPESFPGLSIRLADLWIGG